MAGSRQLGSGSSSRHQAQEDDIIDDDDTPVTPQPQSPATGFQRIYLSQNDGGIWWDHRTIINLLGNSFTSTYGPYVTNWSDCPPEQRDVMFNYFKSFVRTDPGYDLRAAFEERIKKRMLLSINRAATSTKRPAWMPFTCFDLLRKRSDDPKWKAKQAKAQANRKSGGKDGKAPPTSVLGQKSAAAAFKKLEGSEKNPHGVLKMSKQNKRGQWINEKAEVVDAEYNRMKAQHDAGEITHDEFQIYLKAAGGFDRKHRVFGLGSVARDLFVPPGTTPRRHSESSYTPSIVSQYATRNAELEAELQRLQTQQEKQAAETQAMKSRLAAQFGWNWDETCNQGPTPHRRDNFPDDGHGFGSQDVEPLGGS